MTRQRALILGIMREKCPEHLTADEIFSHARQAMPHIARGTVYRNLKLMELDGEIGHLEMPDGPASFHSATSPLREEAFSRALPAQRASPYRGGGQAQRCPFAGATTPCGSNLSKYS